MQATRDQVLAECEQQQSNVFWLPCSGYDCEFVPLWTQFHDCTQHLSLSDISNCGLSKDQV